MGMYRAGSSTGAPGLDASYTVTPAVCPTYRRCDDCTYATSTQFPANAMGECVPSTCAAYSTAWSQQRYDHSVTPECCSMREHRTLGDPLIDRTAPVKSATGFGTLRRAYFNPLGVVISAIMLVVLPLYGFRAQLVTSAKIPIPCSVNRCSTLS